MRLPNCRRPYASLFFNVIESAGPNCKIFQIFRWVPTLTSDDVADRIVSAIQKKEKLAVIPGYLQFMLCIKWYVTSVVFFYILTRDSSHTCFI